MIGIISIIVVDSLTNSFMIMQREDIGNVPVKVSHGKESATWLVVSWKLNVSTMQHGIQGTKNCYGLHIMLGL